MANRRRNRQKRNTFRSYTPPLTVQKRPRKRPLLRERNIRTFQVPINHYLRPKRGTLATTAVLRRNVSRTVRSSSMRTVLSDTKAAPAQRRRPYRPDRDPALLDRSPIGASPALRPFGDRQMLTVGDIDKPRLTRAIICAKRSMRREVLFAFRNLNGSGGRGKPKSNVRC